MINLKFLFGGIWKSKLEAIYLLWRLTDNRKERWTWFFFLIENAYVDDPGGVLIGCICRLLGAKQISKSYICMDKNRYACFVAGIRMTKGETNHFALNRIYMIFLN